MKAWFLNYGLFVVALFIVYGFLAMFHTMYDIPLKAVIIGGFVVTGFAAVVIIIDYLKGNFVK